jgi:death-on-curing protein
VRGHVPKVSDYSLLDADVARPQETVFGLDAYAGDLTEAAALLQSLTRNHAFVEGNKRTAWAAA